MCVTPAHTRSPYVHMIKMNKPLLMFRCPDLPAFPYDHLILNTGWFPVYTPKETPSQQPFGTLCTRKTKLACEPRGTKLDTRWGAAEGGAQGGMFQSEGREKTLRKSSRRHAPHSPESYEDVDVRATTMELRWLPCRPSATEAEEQAEMAYIEYRCGAPPPPRPPNGQGTEHSRILAGKRGCGSPTSWWAALR